MNPPSTHTHSLPSATSALPLHRTRASGGTGRALVLATTVFGGLVTGWREALVQSSGDTTQPHGARGREERTSDWTGTVP